MPFIKKQVGLADLAPVTPDITQQAAALAEDCKKSVAKSYTSAARDFAAEARGKTRCALEEAWAQSPLLSMLLKFEQGVDPLVELHALLDSIVTERMKRVFPNG